jgi:L-threonylcarbamoyladenylate synthase
VSAEVRGRRIDLRALSVAQAKSLVGDVAAAGLLCFPTDTVYGVGGIVAPAVANALVATKAREADKPLQVVYPTRELLEAFLALTPRLAEAVRRLLPGPFTLLLPHPPGIGFPPPGRVTHVGPVGGEARAVPTIGVRVPRWPAGAAALAGLPFPLLASSANRSGEPAPGSLDDVDGRVLAACDLLLDAGPVSGLASTVLDLSEYEDRGRWWIVRSGAAGEDEVAALLAGESGHLPTSGAGPGGPAA